MKRDEQKALREAQGLLIARRLGTKHHAWESSEQLKMYTRSMTKIFKQLRAALKNSKLGHAQRFRRYRTRTESESIRYVQSLDLTGKSVLDIGANRGIYCYFLSRAVGREGTVTAFEPQPECVMTIERVTKMFDLRNIDIRTCGLSDRNTTAPLFRGKPEHGSASLHFHTTEHKSGEEIETNVVTLDSISETLPRPISFIKCDIEGHEVEMLRGAREILTEDKPDILIEIHEDQMPDVMSILTSYGYEGSFQVGSERYPVSQYLDQPRIKGRRHRNYMFECE